MLNLSVWISPGESRRAVSAMPQRFSPDQGKVRRKMRRSYRSFAFSPCFRLSFESYIDANVDSWAIPHSPRRLGDYVWKAISLPITNRTMYIAHREMFFKQPK